MKAAGTFYPSSHERTSESSPPAGSRTPTCPHCYRPSPDHAHLCPAHPPTYDSTPLGLAATKVLFSIFVIQKLFEVFANYY